MTNYIFLLGLMRRGAGDITNDISGLGLMRRSARDLG